MCPVLSLIALPFALAFRLEPATDDALTQKLAAMFDHMRQKQRDDMEEFAASIRAQFVVECADLKNEMTRMRAELVDMRIQYHRMQNGR